MSSVEENVGEPQLTDKEYIDIIKSESEIDKQFIDETGKATKITYYCGDCKKLITPKRMGKKFQFSCSECKGKNVAFGSEKSIQSYYKVSDPE